MQIIFILGGVLVNLFLFVLPVVIYLLRRCDAAKAKAEKAPIKPATQSTGPSHATKKRYREFGLALDEIITWNLEDLKRDYAILVQHDKNGEPMLTNWRARAEQFLTDVAQKTLDPPHRIMLRQNWSMSVRRVTDSAALALKKSPAVLPFSEKTTPAEYEAFCANELRGFGWTVFQTQLVGDQGVDLIAEKDGLRVALQCKLYSTPVGNKAVQEIAAGRVHHRAMFGVVVTNNRYTDAAKALADSNHVHLLHHKELATLEQALTENIGQQALFAAA